MESKQGLLLLEPANELVFVGPFTRQIQNYIKLTNPNAADVLYKIKTTTPKLYCVRPNIGKLGPMESVDIQICLQPFNFESDAKRHKFLIQAAESPENLDNVNDFWKQVNPNTVWDTKIRCVLTLDSDGIERNQNKGDGINKTKFVFSESDFIDVFKREANWTVNDGNILASMPLVELPDNPNREALAELKKLRQQLKSIEFEQNMLSKELKNMRAGANASGKLKPLLSQLTNFVNTYFFYALFIIAIVIASAYVGKYLM